MAISEQSAPRSRIWLVIAGIVALAAVAYVARIYPPREGALSGSVVAADRYRADTSSTSDSSLSLGDQTVAQFMQTDIYQKVISDSVL
jgi:hypothetical protein